MSTKPKYVVRDYKIEVPCHYTWAIFQFIKSSCSRSSINSRYYLISIVCAEANWFLPSIIFLSLFCCNLKWCSILWAVTVEVPFQIFFFSVSKWISGYIIHHRTLQDERVRTRFEKKATFSARLILKIRVKIFNNIFQYLACHSLWDRIDWELTFPINAEQCNLR